MLFRSNPIAVQQHFLLSMVILAAAVVLQRRALLLDGERWVPAVSRPTMRLLWALATLAGVALVTGSVVTGSGPHSGMHKGEPVQRFDLAISSAARVHSVSVLVLLALALFIVWRVRGTADRERIESALGTFLFLGFVQGMIGYIQYFNDVPVVLVAVQIGRAHV